MIERWARTQTRCPLDGEITTLHSTIYADDPITTDYTSHTETESARSIGIMLGCGHILAADRWTHRIAARGPDSEWVGWWTDRLRPGPAPSDYALPDDAVPLKPPAADTASDSPFSPADWRAVFSNVPPYPMELPDELRRTIAHLANVVREAAEHMERGRRTESTLEYLMPMSLISAGLRRMEEYAP